MSPNLLSGKLLTLVLFFFVAAAGGAQPAFQVKDICPGTCSFEPRSHGVQTVEGALLALGDTLLFQADDGTTGTELWRSDGTAEGTFLVKDICVKLPWFGSSPSRPRALTLVGGRAFFVADTCSGAGAGGIPEIWTSDGTAGGTVQPQRSYPTVNPDRLTALGDTLFFSADSGFEGNNLWATDTTSAHPVGAFGTGGTPLSSPKGLTVFGNRLVYNTVSGGLWQTDGTFPGTTPFDIQPDPVHLTAPNQLTVLGDQLFFAADDGTSGMELWKTDGTKSGTKRVKDIRPGPGSSMEELDDRRPGSHFPVAAGGKLFFVADDGVTGRELWQSDGTEAGTSLVKDIRPTPGSSEIFWLTAVGQRVFFVAFDEVHGWGLWVSDGTEAGTRVVLDVVEGPGSSLPSQLTAVDGVLLFSAWDPDHGAEPWRSDGTRAGTRRLLDVAPGPASSSSMEFTAAGPNVYFVADDGLTGFELWAFPKSALLATFADVPADHWAWRYVEAFAKAGLTMGCAAGQFCPSQAVSRAQMAVFLTRGLHGSAFVPPPATGTRFQDVPVSYWAADFIEQLASDGITRGCGPAQFCPDALLNRGQAAVFLLRAKHGAGYAPPPATGTRFQDVPPGYWAGDWIEQLAAEGITNGCGANLYCPEDLLSRDQMAVLLVRTFNLPLP
ncbi:MAG TPA: ELWxxDGT repeat protein [Thermoanaerobaculia bacterium]|jgi:ELWxxDGT repeat protein|nr:ELWxxDGT repeat protein [Thermoanaerobaculia bacterium]